MFDPTIGLDDPIHGDKFVELSDWWWNDRSVTVDRCGGEITTRLPDYMPSEMDEKNGIIFCKTDYIQELFDRIRNAKGKYVLITHNSDWNIDEERYSWKPDSVVGWFAQNVVIDRPNLIPIPIGLERPGIASSGEIEDFKQNWAKKIQKTNLVYVNWSDGTNPKRKGLKDSLRSLEGVTVQDDRLPFREYLEEMSRHRFVVSPPGNGWDCHRTWEALYCGCEPVVYDPPRLLFESLPVKIGYMATPEWCSDNSISIDLNRLGFRWWSNMIRFYAMGWLG